MCGICGIAFLNNPPVDRSGLKRMNRSMAHRGPDEEGYHFGENIWLGHQRLSIIDTVHGNQPMWNEDKTIVTVYNGEIYNFLELKHNLEKQGHVFSSTCDTEVLVHLYEEKGDDFVEELRGMFAFALWDKRQSRLILARDRMGIKPLYYAQRPGGALVFSSEVKGLLALGCFSPELDPDGLSYFLTYDSTPAPRTVLKDIRKVPAGYQLNWSKGYLKSDRFFMLPRYDAPPLVGISLEDASSQMESIFRDSICRHLVSDVPLGVFLSGGLDSAFITAMVSKLTNGSVKTFSITFDEPSFDESYFSRMAANYLETEHHETRMTSSDALNLIPDIAALMDEPLGDPAILPTYLLTKDARKKVVVALSGEGSDELFYGYPTYFAHKVAATYNLLPQTMREKLIRPLVEKLPASNKNFALDFVAKRFVRGSGLDTASRHAVWMSGVFPDKKNLFTSNFYAELQDKTGFCPALNLSRDFTTSPDDLQLASYMDLVLYLQEGILMRTDKASMSNSLEVRVPFLDNEVLNFARKLPERLKLKGTKGKILLKHLAKDLLPPEIIYRKKKGFGLPISQWLQGPLKGLLLDTLSPQSIKRQGIFRPEAINTLINQHMLSADNHRKALWVLLVFELWRKRNS